MWRWDNVIRVEPRIIQTLFLLLLLILTTSGPLVVVVLSDKISRLDKQSQFPNYNESDMRHHQNSLFNVEPLRHKTPNWGYRQDRRPR
jgi:hypothetical protein